MAGMLERIQPITKKMIKDILDARVVDVIGANHFSILFQPNPVRDRKILAFIDR